MHRSRNLALLASVAVSLLLVAGCSTDSESESTCEDLQELASDVRALLTGADLSGDAESLDADLDEVRSAWEQAQETAGDQFGPQLEALEMAVQDLTTTFADLGDGSAADSLDALQGDLAAVDDAWSSLADAVDSELSDCELDAS